MKHLVCCTLLSVIIMLNGNVQGKPQDINEAAILAFAQVKDTIDNGAAASDKKEFEFFGAKVKNDMGIGFGDAVRAKRSNRLPMAGMTSPLIEQLNAKKVKRSASFSDITGEITNSQEKIRTKRETGESSLEMSSNVEDYDYSYSSSSSSSSETDENERRKRSVTNKNLKIDLLLN